MEKLQYHFTPEKGWCNDPNGTIYINGQYHLFYQHYPDDVKWGPMHWGHAVSDDLINWNHCEIALMPDEDGYIFSGSCIYDKDFMGKGALIAYYTKHNPVTGQQEQCMAYSFDMYHFEKYENNPVIVNQIKDSDNYMKDFRDPKVFANPYKGGYTMVLAAGKVIKFYHTLNLTDFEYTGEFDPSIKGFEGVCECPDCFKLECDGDEYWVLTLSSILSDESIGKSLEDGQYPYKRVMQYFVGKFNGDNFECVEELQDKRASVINRMFGSSLPVKRPMVMDFGPDNYAMVSFENTGSQRIMIGWGECWEYVDNAPVNYSDGSTVSKGKMTLPRSVKLVNTDKGMRLSFNVATNIPHESFELSDGQSLTLFGDNGKPLVVTLSDNKIWVLRKPSDVTNDYNSFSAERVKAGKCIVDVYKDGNYFEIFADDGLYTFSANIY